MGWFSGLVGVDYGSEFYFQVRSGHCLAVYSGSQGAAVNIPDTVLVLMALAFKEVRQALSKQTSALSRPFHPGLSLFLYYQLVHVFQRDLALSERLLILELTGFQTKSPT